MKSFVCLLLIVSSYGELYTHQEYYRKTLQRHIKYVSHLNRTIPKSDRSIFDPYFSVSKFYNEYVKSHYELFVSHPLISYLITKHLTLDWNQLISKLNDNDDLDLIEEARERNDFPTEFNYHESLRMLLHLQDTYQLNTADIADGSIKSLEANFRLSVKEIFDIGITSYKSNDFYHARPWLTEALNRFSSKDFDTYYPEAILEPLAYSYYRMNDIDNAIKVTEDLIALNLSKRAVEYKILYENHKKSATVILDDEEEFKGGGVYERLCRGEELLDEKTISKLKCKYTHRTSPYMLIGPLKEETIALRPLIRVYYDVIYEKEIELTKKLAADKFSESKADAYRDGYHDVEDFRIQQYCWLNNDDEIRLRKYKRRMNIITNLNTDMADPIQVAFYGPGGHFDVHIDHAGPQHNRIATWIAYLNEVDYGGATAFTKAGAKVQPIKGSAVFWYNHLSDGTGDDSTEHAGCPVLLGTKWISAVWFEALGNEFNRPCPVNGDYE